MSDWRLVHPYKCLSSPKHHLFLSSPPKTLRPDCAPTFYVFTFCRQYLQAIRRMSDNVYVGTNLICTLSEICCPFLFDSGETINDRRFDVSFFTIYSTTTVFPVYHSMFSVLPTALSQTVKHKTLETNQSYIRRSGRTESHRHTALFSRVQHSDTPSER